MLTIINLNQSLNSLIIEVLVFSNFFFDLKKEAPGETWTHNPQIRSLVRYPIAPQELGKADSYFDICISMFLTKQNDFLIIFITYYS